MRTSNTWAVLAIAALLGYYQIYRWIPLGAWNGQFDWPVRNDQFYPDIVIGLLLLWMLHSFWQVRRVGMWIGVGLLSLWIGVHLSDWWIPYVTGTGEERAGFYRFYGARIQILPTVGRHHPPDGGHAILDVLVLSALVCTFATAVRCRRTRGHP